MRLVVPWMAGVFCGDRFFHSFESFWIVLACCLFIGLTVGFYFVKRYSLRWCFGIAVSALCFSGGWLGIISQLQPSLYIFPSEEAVYRAVITDSPEIKERAVLCRVALKERRDSVNAYPINRKALLYLRQDSAAFRLKRGDELFASVRISPPTNRKNFDEFDYARYLWRKGISGTGYVSSGKWRRLSSDSLSFSSARNTDLRNIAASCRERIIALYRKLGFDGDELAVLCALTIGDKTDLSESIRESYSVAGASHVLALSGLHIGLLYALLFFILRPLAARGNTGRYLRIVFLLVILAGFAFFTGLSPSVVRSVTMFSILALANVFSRQSLSLNTLAATAWLMLLCNPVWLFDIGFQLSFLAVASILLIHQPIYHLFPVKNRITKYIWGLMSVSIAAQVGTAPLIMFYFSRFSTHFLLTNLVVIPLVTIILYSSILMLLFTPFPWIQLYAAETVKYLLNQLNSFVRWIEHLPHASIDGIWLYQPEVWGIYICLLFTFYYVMNKRLKSLFLCLFSLLFFGICHASLSYIHRPKNSLVFYNVSNCPAVHCIENTGQSWLCYGDTLPDKKRLKQVALNYWNHLQLLPPTEITTDYRESGFYRQQQILSYHGCHICMVTDNRWRNKSSVSTLSIDYLYVCKGYDGRLEELTKLFTPSCVIVDASLPEYRKRSLEKECKQSGLRFISLSEEGSVRFLL